MSGSLDSANTAAASAKESAPPETATKTLSPALNFSRCGRTADRSSRNARVMPMILDPTTKWHKPLNAVHV